jgi:hypothetical protein
MGWKMRRQCESIAQLGFCNRCRKLIFRSRAGLILAPAAAGIPRAACGNSLSSKKTATIRPPSFFMDINGFAETHGMAKQKFRPTRPGVFSGAKAYIR